MQGNGCEPSNLGVAPALASLTMIDTQAIRDTLLPTGILRADLDPLAKCVGIYLWHLSGCYQRPFSCHRAEALSWFAISDGRTAKRIFAQLADELLEVIDEPKGGRIIAQYTDRIWRLPTAGSDNQRTFDLYLPAAEFGGNPGLPRLLVPEQFLLSDIPAASKLIAWWAMWAGNLRTHESEIRYSDAGRALGIDPSNVRKSAQKLGSCFELRCQTGSLTFRWSRDLFSQQQMHWLAFLEKADVRAAGWFLELIDPQRRSVNHAHSLPAICGESRQSAPVNRAHETPGLPVSERDLPETGVNGAHDLPVLTPHVYENEMNDMLSGQRVGEDEAARVRRRESGIIGRVDPKGTKRYMVRGWALVVETDRIQSKDGRLVSLTPEQFEEVIKTARDNEYGGGFVCKEIYRLTDCAPKSIRWRDEAERVSRLLGLEFGGDMRDELPRLAKRRYMDAGTDWEMRKGVLYKRLRKDHGLNHDEAMAEVERQLPAPKER